jgi:hypothetical protein
MTEVQLLEQIESLKARERALIVEWQSICEVKVKESREEMQIEIEKLKLEI